MHGISISPVHVAALIIAVVLAACGEARPSTSTTPSSAASPPSPTPIASRLPSSTPTLSSTPIASRLPSTTPTVPASPAVWGPAVWVTGREACSIDRGKLADEPDGMTHHSRDGTVICTDTANDPRVSGRVTGTVDMDYWGPTETDGALVEWATIRLENADGAWVGHAIGTFSWEPGDRLLMVYTGTGAYEGLSYMMWARPTAEEVFAGATYDGLIFPGDPPIRVVIEGRPFGEGANP